MNRPNYLPNKLQVSSYVIYFFWFVIYSLQAILVVNSIWGSQVWFEAGEIYFFNSVTFG